MRFQIRPPFLHEKLTQLPGYFFWEFIVLEPNGIIKKIYEKIKFRVRE
jgi:hypothetical protein